MTTRLFNGKDKTFVLLNLILFTQSCFIINWVTSQFYFNTHSKQNTPKAYPKFETALNIMHSILFKRKNVQVYNERKFK